MSLPFLLYFSRAVGYTVLSTIFLVGVFIAFEPNPMGLIEWFTMSKKSRKEKTKPVRIIPVDEESKESEEGEEIEEEPTEDFGEDAEEESELNIVRPTFAKSASTWTWSVTSHGNGCTSPPSSEASCSTPAGLRSATRSGPRDAS